MASLLIQNIGLLQTPLGTVPAAGSRQGENRKLRNVCILAEDGVISAILPQKEASGVSADSVLDAENRLVTPGLVDCHTHLVFGGWRQHEIPLKLAGASYLEILQAGGGILNTLKSTRTASEQVLFERSCGFLDEMLRLGVTSCEIKSGYGLSTEEELKQLRVIARLNEEHPMNVVGTFMGAHAVPEEYRDSPEKYVNLIVEEMLPLAAKTAAFCDVFCEEGVFTVEQSKKILERARLLGMGLKIHADEIKELGGATLAGELGATSAEHLIATGENGISALARGGVIADLLPMTSFYLDKPYAPARKMVEAGVPVAIASDFNPGSCPSFDLQLAISLAMLRYRLTPEEILTAVTLNAACSLGIGERLGTIEVGKQADLVIWDAEDFDLVCYRFGTNLAKTVIKKGCVMTQ